MDKKSLINIEKYLKTYDLRHYECHVRFKISTKNKKIFLIVK